MEKLLELLQADYPTLHFTAGNAFRWSPKNQEIQYVLTSKRASDSWSLLHETGHALLKHAAYKLDFELIALELAAWQKAEELAARYNIIIDKDYIENCLDSYRDWLHRRSICPSCGTQALQLDKGTDYRCFNCQHIWHVAPSRFCRSYRQSASKTKSPAFL